MKKFPIVLLLSLGMICTSCGTTDGVSSADSTGPQDISSSDNVSSDSGNSSSVDQDDSSSSDVVTKTAMEKLEEMVAKMAEKKSAIASGHINMKTYSESSHDYQYGNDANGEFYYTTSTDWNGVTSDVYVMKTADGGVVGVKKAADGTLSVADTASYGTYQGIGFEYSGYIGYTDSVKAFGAESFVTELLNIAKANKNQDAIAVENEDGSINFSFGFLPTGGWSFYKASITVTASASGALTKMDANFDTYSSGSFKTDDETNSVYLTEGATPSDNRVYNITQVEGARTITNPIDPAGLIPTSFDLTDSGGNVLSETAPISIALGSNGNSVSISHVAPSTANIAFDVPTVTVLDDATGVTANYSSYNGSISLNPVAVGSYKVQVRTSRVTKVFAVTVTPAVPTGIYASYWTVGPTGYEAKAFPESGSLEIYKGVTYLFGASINPTQADQSVSYDVSGFDGKYTSETKKVKINQWADEKDYYFFTATGTGECSITIASAADNSVCKTVALNVVDVPSMTEVLSKPYAIRTTGIEVKYALEFVPDDSNNGMKGSVKIKSGDNATFVNYSLGEADSVGTREFAFTNSDGTAADVNFKLKISQTMTLWLYERVVDESGTVSYVEYPSEMKVADDTFYLNTPYGWTTTSGDYAMTASFYEGGTAYVSYNSSSDITVYGFWNGPFAVSTVDGVKQVTVTSQDDPTSSITFTIADDYSKLNATVTIGEASVAFELTQKTHSSRGD